MSKRKTNRSADMLELILIISLVTLFWLMIVLILMQGITGLILSIFTVYSVLNCAFWCVISPKEIKTILFGILGIEALPAILAAIIVLIRANI